MVIGLEDGMVGVNGGLHRQREWCITTGFGGHWSLQWRRGDPKIQSNLWVRVDFGC